MVDDDLVAAEGVRFGEGAGAASAGDHGVGLVVAEAGIKVVGGGEIVIEADIKLRFVELADGLVDEVEDNCPDCTVFGRG